LQEGNQISPPHHAPRFSLTAQRNGECWQCTIPCINFNLDAYRPFLMGWMSTNDFGNDFTCHTLVRFPIPIILNSEVSWMALLASWAYNGCLWLPFVH
jgi:hypothetical protein